MGFFFDALRSLLSGTAAGRQQGRARMAGRMWDTEGHPLVHPRFPADLDFQIWHYPKGGKHLDFAITLTVSPLDEGARELVLFSLGDAEAAEPSPWAWLVGYIATRSPPPQLGDVVDLPEGCLGRSAHRHVLVAPPWVFSARELENYEQILGAKLVQLVAVTGTEKEWIAKRGGEAFAEKMREQGVDPWVDRRPGDTAL